MLIVLYKITLKGLIYDFYHLTILQHLEDLDIMFLHCLILLLNIGYKIWIQNILKQLRGKTNINNHKWLSHRYRLFDSIIFKNIFSIKMKIGETVLTSLPLHHQSTSIKHRQIHHFHRFLSNMQYFPRLKRRRVVVEWHPFWFNHPINKLPTIVMSRPRIYWFYNMGSFPNSYLIVTTRR